MAGPILLAGMRLLLAEDDVRLRSLLRRGLAENGYVVDEVERGDDALHLLRLYEYAVAVLDWRMPGLDGIEVVRAVRGLELRMPILVLTARDAVTDRVAALDAGADDYLVKPFEFPELLARLRALQRRPAVLQTALRAGGVELDPAARRVLAGGHELRLTAMEYGMLEVLLRRHPGVASRTAIAQHLWEDEAGAVDANTVDVHVTRLRGKLAGTGLRVVNVRGVGYRLQEA
jgi:two-component system copper resistance phosphate regulon response regulator CusR